MRGKSVFHRILILGVVLLGAMIFVGCSEDTVTPNDELTVDQEDVAHQSGFLAFAIVNTLPQLNEEGRVAEEICNLSPFTGCFWHDTAPQHIWTETGETLDWEPEGTGVTISFEFDLTAAGDPLLANGTGKLTLVDFWLNFTVNDVVVPDSGYPTGGTVEVVSPNATGLITFHPDQTATVEVGSFAWNVDMETGEVTPI
ncbi:hypothetical protein H8E52_10635 [bacterium]|nr:hypothetical protein [bacterium]